MSDEEIWTAVSGYEGTYEVSTHGNVRSLDRTDCRGQKRKGRLLRTRTGRKGYPLVNLCLEGVANPALSVHRLVATAFLPPPRPDQTQVNHIDGVKTNNHVANLEWCSPAENNRHACATGLRDTCLGEAHWCAKLDNSAVLEIYRRAWEGEKQADIAADFGVLPSRVSKIKLGVSWAHVTGGRIDEG